MDDPGQNDSEADWGGDVAEEIENAITNAFGEPVKKSAETLNGMLTRIFKSYPNVRQSSILEIHQKTFQISLALASAAAVWIGILHLLNRIDGIRPLTYLLGALAFGAVAPFLLQYPVKLSRLFTEALLPVNTGLLQASRFSFELFLVLLADVFLLLGIVLIFVVRDVYLMLGVVLAPLVALMAATPSLRGVAGMLTRIWIAFLLIGPLDAVVLDLTLSLMGSSVVDVPHYLWGLGGIALLFGLPLILLGAGAVFFAPMTRVVTRGSSKVRRAAEQSAQTVQNSNQGDDFPDDERDRRRTGSNRFQRNRDDRS